MTETQNSWRYKMHEIIFEADTFAGKLFDIALLWAILISVLAVMLESVKEIRMEYGDLLLKIEWFFTILFTIEYLARIMSVGKPFRYMTSFLGIIDLLSILPTYLGMFFVGSQSLIVIRSIRLLRIFRILKLARFVHEGQNLINALHESRHKIIVFIGFILTIVTIMGTLMFSIEGEASGFTSIPKSIYWSIVTLTTVGYGDIAPKTPIGQALASCIMILGYAIIAVPTGIVSVKLAQAKKITTQACPECSSEGHDHDAIYCKYCGIKLNP